MMIGNSVFNKNWKNKYTWVRSERGVVTDRALMDYVLIRRSLVGRLKDVHVYRGAAAGLSDHFLVEMKLVVAKVWRGK
ncbi:hypothetical protein, partial [Klebsiella pneumoniae]|uniref:hypothetical protein n=1 Tax=Klebsiella pneumoniae TaxID=573 RepID=UPI003EBD5E1D